MDDDTLPRPQSSYAIVGSWPARFHTPRAQRLGLRADTSFDDIVRAYLADNPGAGAG